MDFLSTGLAWATNLGVAFSLLVLRCQRQDAMEDEGK